MLIWRRVFQTDEWVRILPHGTLGPVVPTAEYIIIGGRRATVPDEVLRILVVRSDQ